MWPVGGAVTRAWVRIKPSGELQRCSCPDWEKIHSVNQNHFNLHCDDSLESQNHSTLQPCSCPDSERLNSRSEESEEFSTVFMMLTGARGRVFAVFVVLMCVSGVCESGCADRPSPKCCPGRNNKCAEFTGRRSVCYCDTYCQKTGDCCEDYQTTCRISGEV